MMILFDSCLIPSICACHVSSVSKNRVSQSKGGNFLNFLNFLNFNNVLLNDMCVRRIRVDQPCDKISTWTGGYFLLPSVNPILVQQFYLAKLFFIILNLFFQDLFFLIYFSKRLFVFIKEKELCNFVDDNSLLASNPKLDQVKKKTLEISL